MAQILGNCRVCDGYDITRLYFNPLRSQVRGFENSSIAISLVNMIKVYVCGGVIVTGGFSRLRLMSVENDPKIQSMVTAVYDVGCIPGVIATIYIGEGLGRKSTLMPGTMITSVGSLLQTPVWSLESVTA